MSANDPEASEQERIERNVQRTVGQSALKEIRGIVDEERRMEASNARFLRAFMKYGWIIMLLVSLALAHVLGLF
jgi:hypothetical protein